MIDRCHLDPACWRREIARGEALVARSPRSLVLRRALLFLASDAPRSLAEELVPELRADLAHLAAAEPNEASVPYLEAVVASDDERGTSLLRRALALDPTLAWAHFGLAGRLAADSSGPDDARNRDAIAHFDEFVRLCPERYDLQLARLRSRDPIDRLRRELPRIRTGLERQLGAGGFLSFPELWELELASAEIVDHARVRQQVQRDLERVRALSMRDDADWYRALGTGARLLADDAGLRESLDGLARTAPCDDFLMSRRLNQIRDELEPREGDDRLAGHRAQSEALVRATRPWLLRCPGSLRLLETQLLALRMVDEESSSEQTATRAQLLDGARRRDEPFFTIPSLFYLVAQGDSGRGVPASEILGLLDEDLLSVDRDEASVAARLAAATEAHRRARLSDFVSLRFDNFALRAAVALRDGERAAARDRLDQMASLLDSPNAPSGDLASLKRAELLESCGRLAELEGRPIEAIALFEAALRSDDSLRGASSALARLQQSAPNPARAALAESAAIRLPSENWTSDGRTLPSFELLDLAGKPFSSTQLGGKIAWINFWATWCQPCIEEMPALHRLAELYRGDERVVVLTVAIDSMPAIVEPMVRKQGWTLPVLLGRELFEATEPDSGVPTTWLVDPRGIVSRSTRGFDASAPGKWTRSAVAQIESILATLPPETELAASP